MHVVVVRAADEAVETQVLQAVVRAEDVDARAAVLELAVLLDDGPDGRLVRPVAVEVAHDRWIQLAHFQAERQRAGRYTHRVLLDRRDRLEEVPGPHTAALVHGASRGGTERRDDFGELVDEFALPARSAPGADPDVGSTRHASPAGT